MGGYTDRTHATGKTESDYRREIRNIGNREDTRDPEWKSAKQRQQHSDQGDHQIKAHTSTVHFLLVIKFLLHEE